VQEERFQRFMELQQQVSIRKLARKVGKEMLVLIDECGRRGRHRPLRRRCPRDRRPGLPER
jgi:tRNA A37 methylthiotransferase MiaB